MKKTYPSVAVLALLAAMAGCAQNPAAQRGANARPSPAADRMPVTVAGAAESENAGSSGAGALFVLGRAAHGSGQLLLAAQRYAQVLEIDPQHVGALNALAVIHAQEDRMDDAMKLFRRALAIAPEAGHIHNNAGYALMRAGRLDEARAELSRAQELNPASLQTRQNLELLTQESAQASARGAVVAAVVGEGTALRTEPAPVAQVVAVAPNVYELKFPGTPVAAKAEAPAAAPVALQRENTTPSPATPALASAAAPVTSQGPALALVSTAPSASKPPSDALRGVRLEVANGVGITNLARRTADRLAPLGLVTARLSNVKHFRQAKTEIQYVAGQDQSAQALQSRLPVSTRTVAAGQLPSGVQIKLVLGHDVAGKAIAAWLGSEEPTRLAAGRAGGWMWG